jgi:hypothetical protein
LIKKLLEASHTYYTLDDFSIQGLMDDDPISFLKAQSTSVFMLDDMNMTKILSESIWEINQLMAIF